SFGKISEILNHTGVIAMLAVAIPTTVSIIDPDGVPLFPYLFAFSLIARWLHEKVPISFQDDHVRVWRVVAAITIDTDKTLPPRSACWRTHRPAGNSRAGKKPRYCARGRCHIRACRHTKPEYSWRGNTPASRARWNVRRRGRV